MGGPGEHYAKWNKPVRERQIPYDFTYMWKQTELTSEIETNSQMESRLTAKGGEREGVEGLRKKDSWTWTTIH